MGRELNRFTYRCRESVVLLERFCFCNMYVFSVYGATSWVITKVVITDAKVHVVHTVHKNVGSYS